MLLPTQTQYSLRLKTQPANQYCSISNASGSFEGDAVVQATVTCSNLALALLAGNYGGPGNTDGSGADAHFLSPQGIASDSAGNVFVADTYNHTIRKISPDGIVSTVAGATHSAGYADGTATTAYFYFPQGVAVDGSETVYVADSGNDTIRTISASGAVSTLAGTAGVSGVTDGAGSVALFDNPQGIAVDDAGNVYVADTSNETIRKITPAGAVSTLAGTPGSSGFADGVGSTAQFDNPQGVAVDESGNVYVADSSNNTIRKISSNGLVSTLAGSPGVAGATDGVGSVALFNEPQGISVDHAGFLYVADSRNHTVRKISPGGVVSTLAGVAMQRGWTDGTTTLARFHYPEGIATDDAGNTFVADTNNHSIRKISPTGVVSTVAGSPSNSGYADGIGSAALFDQPQGLAADQAGDILVADRNNSTIRKIAQNGEVITLAGKARAIGYTDGPGNMARFDHPYAMASDSLGNLLVADTYNNTIRKISPSGTVSTLAGMPRVSGSSDGAGSSANFYFPFGLAVDSNNDVYVADTYNQTIRKITPEGVVSTVAGQAGVTGSANGTATTAQFSYPKGLCVDNGNNLYVADSDNQTIRKITPAGLVSTLAGVPGQTGFANGTGNAARFDDPQDMACDGTGNVYVSDTRNHSIRKISPSGLVTTVVGSPATVGVSLTQLPASLDNPYGLAVFDHKLYIASRNAVVWTYAP